MILISNGGSNIHRAKSPPTPSWSAPSTASRCWRESGEGWAIKHRALAGCFVSAVTALDDGTLFAATHGIGVAKSEDGGITWSWCNEGLAHFDLWSARGGKLQGRDVVLVGSLPAHVYISENKGKSWRELTAFRNTPSVDKWFFPPPPRIGHVKDIVLDGDRLLVGVEIGSLSVSMDFGETFTELPVDPDPRERDIHRVLVHPERPDRLIVANGIVGLVTSEDRGKTWRRNKMPDKANYPDAIVLSPDNPGSGVHDGGHRLAVELVRGRARARKNPAQPRRRRDLDAAARRAAGWPARGVLRAHHRDPRRRGRRSMPPTPTARCSRA